MPVDTVEGRDARATSIADLVTPRLAACGRTAAWIHGAGDQPPAVHHVRRVSASRFRSQRSFRVVFHERRLPPEEVMQIAGIAVATPLSAAVEMLFQSVIEHADDRWLRALLLADPGLGCRALAHVEQLPRRPGRRLGLNLLAEIISAQDVVTR